LERFRSFEELKMFVETRRIETWYGLGGRATLFLSDSTGLKQARDWGIANEYEYSRTNIQVQGVDEADIVKSDGEYLYMVSNDRVLVVKAYPPEDASVVSRLVVGGPVYQIFLSDDRLAVFYDNCTSNRNRCIIRIYEVSDKRNPIVKREIAVEGDYLSSRMIGDYVYAVVKRDIWRVENEDDLPRIFFADKWEIPSPTRIYYSEIADYFYRFMTIVSLNVKDDGVKPNYFTMVSGSTTLMYVSNENIYLAIYCNGKTILHSIHIVDGEISRRADGRVPGAVLDQFSMDEYGGYFRVATTSQATDMFDTGWPVLLNENNVYILDENLALTGKLEHLAPGETIHSARFAENVCYLVTFRKIDPFFSIDVSNPNAPRVIGELKITGYSDYLHPYDQNHVIGVGKDTVPAEEGDFSWHQGVKISLFDTTEMDEPKEIAKYVIGDRGSSSPVLNDHKAFLLDNERDLLALPVTVTRIDKNRYPDSFPPNTYGDPIWQGAYVFKISLDLPEKMVLKGTITHINDGNVLDASRQIVRIMFIENVLYTVSQTKVKLNSLLDLSELRELSLDG
jgi:uncharacterized secreted protein with C-terminal beta-propeller domain